MTTDKLNRLWLLATFILIILILSSCLVIWMKNDTGHPVTISSPSISNFQGEIYIGGAISNPGIYPLKDNDNITAIIQASGGTTDNADLSRISLYIPQTNEKSPPQKVNINLAEIWLLQALPDIGKVRAQAIYDYRQKNGPFRNIEEVTKVTGIGNATFDKIKTLITIGE